MCCPGSGSPETLEANTKVGRICGVWSSRGPWRWLSWWVSTVPQGLWPEPMRRHFSVCPHLLDGVQRVISPHGGQGPWPQQFCGDDSSIRLKPPGKVSGLHLPFLFGWKEGKKLIVRVRAPPKRLERDHSQLRKTRVVAP